MTEDPAPEFRPEPAPEPAPGPADTAAPQRRSLLARPVVTGLLGVLVGALLVGVPWLVLSLLGGGGPSGRSLTAPASLGGLSRAQEAIAKLDKAKGQTLIARIEKTDRSFVTDCQRTGPGLTVKLRSLSSEGNRDPRELAGIVEQAWRELA